jgi:hypothetical protein
MSFTDPQTTTLEDLCRQALKECGAIGVGQTPLAEDINEAWGRLQYMLLQWEAKRWLVYHLRTLSKQSTGQISYTVGPGGEFDTGTTSVRPARLASAFTRQQFGSPNPIDYPLQILQSMEDYNWITIKHLIAGPGEAAFLDTAWPLANLFVWPVPQAHVYEIHITLYEQLPYRFTALTTPVVLPYQYYGAILYNLAVRLRPKYRLGTYPGDHLPGMARDSLAVLRGGQTQITRLHMPSMLRRRGSYNIFSDRNP